MIEELLFGTPFKSHGSSRFARGSEIQKFLKPYNKGLYLANGGRISAENSFKHLLLLAPTGAGKTTKYLLNNALRKWRGNNSLVFFDPSGEIHSLSKNWLRRQGFSIRAINLSSPTDSEKYNPLWLVADKSSARMVAQSLVNIIYSENSADPFWSESAVQILTLLIFALKNGVSPEQNNIYTLLKLLNKFGDHGQEEVDGLMGHALSGFDFDEYCSFMANPEKIRMSILATVKSAIYIYSDPILQEICDKNSFDLQSVREEKTALFLIQEEHKVPFFQGFWSLFFRQFFEVLTKGGKNSVYIFMDEFANFGRISDFDTIISTIRKRKVHLSRANAS